MAELYPPLPAPDHYFVEHTCIYTGSNLRNILASDIMRIRSLLSVIALLASTALAAEIVCTSVPNVFTLSVFVDHELS